MSKILNQTYVGRTSCGVMDFLVLPTALRTIILSLESIGKKSRSGYAHAQHLFSPTSHLLNMRACLRLCELSGCMWEIESARLSPISSSGEISIFSFFSSDEFFCSSISYAKYFFIACKVKTTAAKPWFLTRAHKHKWRKTKKKKSNGSQNISGIMGIPRISAPLIRDGQMLRRN